MLNDKQFLLSNCHSFNLIKMANNKLLCYPFLYQKVSFINHLCWFLNLLVKRRKWSWYLNHAFLHCNSTYPAPPEDINLAYISRLGELTNCVSGYSSHDGNIYIPYVSIGFGARIIECHITREKVKFFGTVSRLDSIQAVILNFRLKKLENIIHNIEKLI